MNLVKDRVSTRRRFFSIHLRHASRFAGPLLAATAVLVPAPVPADGLERGYAVADDSRSRSESPPAAVAGSAEWLLVKEALSPDPEGGRVMAFDSARGRAVLFGGRTPDTWEWDGTSWFRRTPVANPAFREGPGMAYDAARGLPRVALKRLLPNKTNLESCFPP